MITMMGLNNIGRFELVRRVLNHVAVIDLYENADLIYGQGNFAARLEQYARLVREAHARTTDEAYPSPVMPVIDLAHLMISHTSCTGNTKIKVTEDMLDIDRVWNGGARDRVLQAIMHGDDLPDEARVYITKDDLVDTGKFDSKEHFVTMAHGEWALYTGEGYDVLYTTSKVYKEFDYGMYEDGWMGHAPVKLIDEVQKVLTALGYEEDDIDEYEEQEGPYGGAFRDEADYWHYRVGSLDNEKSTRGM